MNKRSKARLAGVIRLVDSPSSIGIPLFSTRDLNYDMVPETDGALRISRFLDFTNECEYPTVRSLPPSLANMELSIGDAIPIIFWIDNDLQYVQLDTFEEDLPRLTYSQDPSGVAKDIISLVSDAREGRLIKRMNAGRIAELKGSYGDVLESEPSHSRYWITRLFHAIENAKDLQIYSDQFEIQAKALAHEWIVRFTTKTDYPRLSLLLSNRSSGLFQEDQIRNILFAFFCHKLANGDFHPLESSIFYDDFFLTAFPSGIYFHYSRAGYPKVGFGYNTPDNLLDVLKRRIVAVSTLKTRHSARKLSFLYFGTNNAPLEISNFIFERRSALVDSFVRDREHERVFNEVTNRNKITIKNASNHSEYSDQYKHLIQRLLQRYEAIRDLEGVEFGSERMSPGRFRSSFVDENLINELKLIAREF